MADERAIAVGDLVQVVKLPSCGCGTALGWIFVVKGFVDTEAPICLTCREFRTPDQAALSDGFIGSVEVYRLKRIPPLGELEGKRTEENIRESIDA